MSPQEYRLKHRRCKFCIYKKFHHVDFHDWYECLVKDKYISEFDWLEKWRGMFCKVYEPKEIDFDI